MGGDVPSHIMEQIVLENITEVFIVLQKNDVKGFDF